MSPKSMLTYTQTHTHILSVSLQHAEEKTMLSQSHCISCAGLGKLRNVCFTMLNHNTKGEISSALPFQNNLGRRDPHQDSSHPC